MVDLHNDALLQLPPQKLLPYLRQAKKDGVKEIWLSVWTTELKNPLLIIERKKLILDKIAGDPLYPICRLHIEDAWFLNEQNIQKLIALKPHSIGLTWNYANNLAGGADSKQGITPLGYKIIEILENAGIQIDTAHLNRRSFWQFSKVTRRPIICTHTALHSVHKHKRNLTNRQIKTIYQSGGYFGLALVPKFLCKNTIYCGIHNIINHIFTLKNLFPDRIFFWGTDFFGIKELPAGIFSYKNLKFLPNARIIGHTVLKQPIIAYFIGNPAAKQRLLITAGMHAREWITSLALQNWLDTLETIPDDFYLAIIPHCNPDGTLLANNKPDIIPKRTLKSLQKINHNSNDFSLWKANLHAVDLNVNFNAGWGQGTSNITTPSPANYIGPRPHSEPETKAILKLINSFRPTASLALHSKGNLIYYSRIEDKQTANELSNLTKFPAILSSNSFGGLTDYLALRKKIPSFTIELGDDKFEHPIPIKCLPSITNKLTQIINYFLTGA